MMTGGGGGGVACGACLLAVESGSGNGKSCECAGGWYQVQ